MQSVELALAADFWRRGWSSILLTLLAITAMPMWIFAALGWDGGIQPDTEPAVVLHVTLTLVMGFGVSSIVLAALGSLSRFYVRPISTARLVACQLGLGAAAVALTYLVAASVINLGGAHWPVVGPTLFIATAFVSCVTVLWWLEGAVFAQLVGCCCALVPLGVWFSRCYGARFFGGWNQMWREPAASELLTLAAVCLVAYAIAVVGVARTRRGELWDFAALAAWWERLLASIHTSPARFRAPLAAQVWSLWQKFGIAPACIVACIVVGGLVGRVLGFHDSRLALEMSFFFPVTVQIYGFPLILGLVHGNLANSKGIGPMRNSLATLPVTDTFLAKALLLNAAKSVLAAWVVWLVGMAVTAGLIWLAGEGEVFRILQAGPSDDPAAVNWRTTIFLIVLALPGAWMCMANMITVMAWARLWFWIAFVGCSGMMILYANLCRFLSDQQVRLLNQGSCITLGIAMLAVTLVAFVFAFRRKLVTASFVWGAAGAAIVAAVVLFLAWPPQWARPAWLVLGVGNLALAFLPLASLPLAIRWNRHR